MTIRYTGRLTQFNLNSGYGFIVRSTIRREDNRPIEQLEEDIFFHVKDNRHIDELEIHDGIELSFVIDTQRDNRRIGRPTAYEARIETVHKRGGFLKLKPYR